MEAIVLQTPQVTNRISKIGEVSYVTFCYASFSVRISS